MCNKWCAYIRVSKSNIWPPSCKVIWNYNTFKLIFKYDDVDKLEEWFDLYYNNKSLIIDLT